jgi:hypothetical protein
MSPKRINPIAHQTTSAQEETITLTKKPQTPSANHSFKTPMTPPTTNIGREITATKKQSDLPSQPRSVKSHKSEFSTCLKIAGKTPTLSHPPTSDQADGRKTANSRLRERNQSTTSSQTLTTMSR